VARLVLIGRVALLALAAGGAIAGLMLGRRSVPLPARAGALYSCPMHREIQSAVPGNCPICGMVLTPTARSARQGPDQPPFDVRPVRVHAMSKAILAPARVDENGQVVALLHADELAVLGPGEGAMFATGSAPTATIAVRRRADQPRAWDEETMQVAFDVEGELTGAVPGQAGWLALAPSRQQLIVVPEMAVLRSRDGPFVMVASAGDRRFVERPVRVGRGFFGNLVITDGLSAGERIATSKAFFLDAERRLLDPTAEAVEVGP
jgi:hypothetical protein